jgi:hypothetical protein
LFGIFIQNSFIMKKTILFLNIFASASLLMAQEVKTPVPPVNPNAPEIVFEGESHDFGTIKQGDNGTYEFKFKNSGKEPLIISNARGSCGCTVPSWPKDPIKPGGTGTIKVTYDTQRVGPFSKTVTINSNAKTQEKVISIKGKVEAPPPEETFPSNGINKVGSPFESNK